MVRLDAGGTLPTIALPSDLCLSRGFNEDFVAQDTIGKGGFGKVYRVVRRCDGREFACKILRKKDPAFAPGEQARHLNAIRREVAVLKDLRHTESVVHLYSAYEDEDSVYIVMELCQGGELWHKNGLKHYSEQEVARIMRAVLRTLARCHSQNILHRDVKPSNFMYLSNDWNSPIKAVDFGLAVYYFPDSLPREDLGFSGTPWYTAPEVLESAVVPASDVWAAGVMAYQLLTGSLPFDDRKNKNNAALSTVWRSILYGDIDYQRSSWNGVSDEAKDFVKSLLVRDPAHRPSAKQALKHPWVSQSESNSAVPTQSLSVVERVQRPSEIAALQGSAHGIMTRQEQPILSTTVMQSLSVDKHYKTCSNELNRQQATRIPRSHTFIRRLPNNSHLMSYRNRRILMGPSRPVGQRFMKI